MKAHINNDMVSSQRVGNQFLLLTHRLLTHQERGILVLLLNIR